MTTADELIQFLLAIETNRHAHEKAIRWQIHTNASINMRYDSVLKKYFFLQSKHSEKHLQFFPVHG